MVKAELIYNPYVMTLNVRFNNQKPRINSLIEKYQDKPLQTWISRVPQIFHDEMNGYDFDLEFSGTLADFRELNAAFAVAGVTEEDVRLFHKNELDDRQKKRVAIEELLVWLSENQNHRFDYEEFRRQNKNLYDDSFPYILLHGNNIDTTVLENTELGVEYINAVTELSHTELTDTPIIVCVSKESLDYVESDIEYLLNRDDVIQEQIFFLIVGDLKERYIKRMISDMGVKSPQMVKSIDDPTIIRYFELYPLSDYITQALDCFRKETNLLANDIAEEAEKSAMANKAVYSDIESLENEIQKFKEVLNEFVNRDNLQEPVEWLMARKNLISEIQNWRIRKTKINSIEEALIVADDLETVTRELFDEFIAKVRNSYNNARHLLVQGYEEFYETTGYTMSDTETYVQISTAMLPGAPELVSELMKIKEERHISQQLDFFGFFRAMDNAVEYDTIETTYYYQSWRDYVIKKIEPILDEILRIQFDAYRRFDDALSGIYISKLKEQIQQKQEFKDTVSEKLSGEEQALQADNKWVEMFVDQLQHIERD